MTNERAIELLHRLQDEQFDGQHGDERREALSMAVRALEGDGDMISRQAVMKEFSDFVRKSNNSDFAQTPTWNDAVSLVGSMPSAQIATDINVGDTISRKMAIDIVDIAKDLCHDAFGKGALKAVRDKLSELPPENTKRKKGKWEKGYFYGNVYRCSVCHEPIEIPYTHCPSCGAFMSPYIGKLQRGEHDG